MTSLLSRLLYKPFTIANTTGNLLLLLPSARPLTSKVIRGKRRQLREKLQIPQPPKLPPTPYILYFSERCKELNKKTELNGNELTKLISEEWTSMTDKKREEYNKKYAEILESYREEIDLYNIELSQEDKEIYRKEQHRKHISIEKRKFGQPAHVQSAFILFLSDHRGDPLADTKIKWEQLTDSEKLLYHDRAKEDEIRYKEEMEIWELQMMIEGNFHVVRPKTLKSRDINPLETSKLTNNQLGEFEMEYDALTEKYNERKPEIYSFIYGTQKQPRRRQKKKETKEAQYGKPAHPLNSFTVFRAEHEGSEDINLKWKGLSESEKAVYIEKSKESVKRYQEEMVLWENAMIAEKKFHLVRQKTLKSRGINLPKGPNDSLQTDKC